MFTQLTPFGATRMKPRSPSTVRGHAKSQLVISLTSSFVLFGIFPFSLHSHRSVFPSFSTIFIGTDAKKKELHLWCLCLAWQNLAIFHPKILAAFFGKKRKKQYLFLLLPKNLQKISFLIIAKDSPPRNIHRQGWRSFPPKMKSPIFYWKD